MRQADQLAAFVGDALREGRSRDDIRTALGAAGWSPSEVDSALDAWADLPFVPPVPRPRPYLSAREAFLYGILFMALAVTAWHLVWLLFELIDIAIREPGETIGLDSRNAVRWAIAALVVAFPTFWLLNSHLRRAAATNSVSRRSAIRRWFGYLTLFLAAIALASDLVAAVFALLTGDLTLRFVLKALTVAIVAGIIFLYFRAQLAEAENAP